MTAAVALRSRLLSSPWFLLTVGFVVSRLVYALLGVRFDSTPFTTFWQYADPRAIQRDPIGTFINLHIQPPLFNVVLAAAGKLFLYGVGVTLSLHGLFLAMGYALAASSFAVGQRLGLSARQAVALALVISCNPTAILFENHLFYTYPTAVLLVVSTLLAMRYVDLRRRRDALLFFAALAAVILTRSLYHPVWFLLAGVALMVFANPALWRRTLLAAGFPFVLVVAFYAKNVVLFDEFSSSSWFGMNLAKASTFQIPGPERADLVRQGRLSTLALRPLFEYYSVYADSGYGTPPTRPTGHPVLDDPVRSNQSPNFNYKGYLGIYRQYRKDALASIRLRPRAYLRGQAMAHAGYLNSPTDFFAGGRGAGEASARNFRSISALDRAWRTVVYGEVPPSLTKPTSKGRTELASRGLKMGLITGAAMLAVVIGGLRVLWAVLRARLARHPHVVGALFAWATVLYVTVVANGLDVGENNRFRYEVEPLLFILTAWLAHEVWSRRRRPLPEPGVSSHAATPR